MPCNACISNTHTLSCMGKPGIKVSSNTHAAKDTSGKNKTKMSASTKQNFDKQMSGARNHWRLSKKSLKDTRVTRILRGYIKEISDGKRRGRKELNTHHAWHLTCLFSCEIWCTSEGAPAKINKNVSFDHLTTILASPPPAVSAPVRLLRPGRAAAKEDLVGRLAAHWSRLFWSVRAAAAAAVNFRSQLAPRPGAPASHAAGRRIWELDPYESSRYL